MDLATFQYWLALGLAVAFAGGAVANLFGPAKIRDAYREWGYPKGFHLVTGLLDAAAAGALAWPPARCYGAALALAITIAALATLAWHGQWAKTPGSLVFLGLLGVLLI